MRIRPQVRPLRRALWLLVVLSVLGAGSALARPKIRDAFLTWTATDNIGVVAVFWVVVRAGDVTLRRQVIRLR
jgi:hypothetical protein